MQQLNLPPCRLTIKNEPQNKYIFDIIRKKYLVLTPEEWVRQHFVHFLINYKNFPQSLMRTENGLKLFNTIKRSDIVVYNRDAKAMVVVECKAPEVKISQDTFDQIARYNIHFNAPFLIVTNGLDTYCVKKNFSTGSYEFLSGIPNFNDIINYENNFSNK
ncbi:MAG: type I restriction enzyme HsdR N-terminal domain-containing protein [Bacteroidales bacterium]|nr:type I restriction enzyme HsdR N-terminal domain-containing protein [Bacteroidales bacterium]